MPVSDKPTAVADNSPMSEHPMWFVLGAGSIGCLFAAHMQRNGVPVTLLLRDQSQCDLLQGAGGITLETDARRALAPVPCLAANALAHDCVITQLLVCTKAHQTRAAIAAIRANIAADATLVLLQNGMGVREELLEQLPCAEILHGLSTEGAWRRERFHVVHAGRGETLLGGGNLMQAKTVWSELHACGLDMRVVDDIAERLWTKLAINCVINPLTALHRCRNGELLNLANINEHTRDICDELATIADTQGVTLNSGQLQQRVLAVMQSTASNQSSMLQDVLRGQATEIDYLNGYVVKLAESLHLSARANRELLVAIKNLA